MGKTTLEALSPINLRYMETLRFIVERFNIHLTKENKLGIIIHDSVGNVENRFKRDFYKFVLNEEQTIHGVKKGKYRERIYPSIFFSEDEHSEILQICDIIARCLQNAIWEHLYEIKVFNPSKVPVFKEENKIFINYDKLPDYNKYLKVYWPLFVKSPGNNSVDRWSIKFWW